MDKIVKRVQSCGQFQLEIEFTDGLIGRLDVSQRLFGPVFEPLRNAKLFEQVCVDQFGAICWPNGADLAPDALYGSLAGTRGQPAKGTASSW